ncbi:MAG: plastocyanin [Bacteroidia bacterium]|jgi:plastocyanin
MKTKTLLSALFLIASTSVFATTWTVTNSGNTFTPATITIDLGDDVIFNITNAHDAREVSEVTWDANGNTALPGGFQTPFGGGTVAASQLGVGTHYYVCTPHAFIGMLGRIIVQDLATGIASVGQSLNVTVYPNPATDFIKVDLSDNSNGVTYQVFNALGVLVMTGKLNDEVSTIDVRNLPSGTYLMQLKGRQNTRLKFVKH